MKVKSLNYIELASNIDDAFRQIFPPPYPVGGIWSAEANHLLHCIQRLHIKVHLENLSTYQLLNYLNHARAFRGSYSPCDSNSWFRFTIEEIREELAKRPHIKNKKEKLIERKRKR